MLISRGYPAGGHGLGIPTTTTAQIMIRRGAITSRHLRFDLRGCRRQVFLGGCRLLHDIRDCFLPGKLLDVAYELVALTDLLEYPPRL
jgi:hypothetical protein